MESTKSNEDNKLIYLTHQDLENKEKIILEKDEVYPDFNQLKYQKDELAIFIHFGPNTFNEVEWGDKYFNKSPNEIFRLKNDFKAEKFVKTIKKAGFKKIIITAKHHDGFVIWQSKYTDYGIKNTDYKNGKGDILEEISKYASIYDIDMGLYLSPWDIHESSYGYYDKDGNPTTKENDHLDYNDYYDNQLKEILSNPKYGNKGRFVEIWMDGAKGTGFDEQEYDFLRWFNTIQKYQGKEAGYDADCMLFGAEAYTSVRWIGNELGFANENTWSKSNVDYKRNIIDSNTIEDYTKGFKDGNKWTVPESDARITSGWFWGKNKNTPKTIKELAQIYFRSVGHGSTLLLNIPPNDNGDIDNDIYDRILEFGKNIKESFSNNLIINGKISATSVRNNSKQFSPQNLIIDDGSWTCEENENEANLLIELEDEKYFDAITIEENIGLGQRIDYYKIEYLVDSKWNLLKEGETIGAKRIVRFSPISARKLRLNIKTYNEKSPSLKKIGIYKLTKDFELENKSKIKDQRITIEKQEYKIKNDSKIEIKILRFGNLDEELEVLFEPNPATAIQSDFDTEEIQKIIFEKGQKEKLAYTSTKNSKSSIGKYYTINISTNNKNVDIYPNKISKIWIE